MIKKKRANKKNWNVNVQDCNNNLTNFDISTKRCKQSCNGEDLTNETSKKKADESAVEEININGTTDISNSNLKHSHSGNGAGVSTYISNIKQTTNNSFTAAIDLNGEFETTKSHNPKDDNPIVTVAINVPSHNVQVTCTVTSNETKE